MHQSERTQTPFPRRRDSKNESSLVKHRYLRSEVFQESRKKHYHCIQWVTYFVLGSVAVTAHDGIRKDPACGLSGNMKLDIIDLRYCTRQTRRHGRSVVRHNDHSLGLVLAPLHVRDCLTNLADALVAVLGIPAQHC
jgi:hypothetical protein